MNTTSLLEAITLGVRSLGVMSVFLMSRAHLASHSCDEKLEIVHVKRISQTAIRYIYIMHFLTLQ